MKLFNFAIKKNQHNNKNFVKDEIRKKTIARIKNLNIGKKNFEDELEAIIKDFFSSFFKIRYEFSYDELKNELDEKKINKQLKDKIGIFLEEYSEIKFSSKDKDSNNLLAMINRFIELIDELTFDKTKELGITNRIEAADKSKFFQENCKILEIKPHDNNIELNHCNEKDPKTGFFSKISKKLSLFMGPRNNYQKTEEYSDVKNEESGYGIQKLHIEKVKRELLNDKRWRNGETKRKKEMKLRELAIIDKTVKEIEEIDRRLLIIGKK